ncbi:MAG: hypothetical protein QOD99_1026 [Chthoniobacter sp.]|nr:hypothetical protein [Chthoniobacter sp.]
MPITPPENSLLVKEENARTLSVAMIPLVPRFWQKVAIVAAVTLLPLPAFSAIKITKRSRTNVLAVTVAGSPTISTPPVSQSALLGTNPYFTVVASGSTALSYQWNKASGPVTGGTSATLSFNNVQLTDAGDYSVTVSNSLGAVTSGSATLTVILPATATPPTLPTIPQRTFLVTSYGAVSGTNDNTTAIQAALNAAKTAGGGIVKIPAASASYLCGPITINGATNLQLDYGATLRLLPYYTGTAATPPAGYYPLTGSAYASFLTAKNVNDIAITGQGTIDGQGQAWWTAYTANGSLPHRPYMISISGGNRTLVTGVTLKNSPSFHLAVNSDNLTTFGLTVTASGTTPLNTDGLDPSGSHHLHQNLYVAVGDDNVVMKPGGNYCSDIMIANCTFGSGHGVSIGGQTNKGLDGMIVKNCTFNGTTTGLRMKADATQGGMVQNVTYTDLTMINVPYPIVFYSYYKQIGTPGSVSGSSHITPAIVNSWNGDSTTVTNSATNPKTANQPINPLNPSPSTLSGWRNITLNNFTATGATGYSIIWGLPLANYLISNVTLNNVRITGGAGLELYDATGVQITGTTSVGSYVICNALAITGQPTSQTVNSGSSVTLAASVLGASGLNGTLPTFQWKFNGAALVNGTNADASVITGATSNSLKVSNIKPAEAGNYTLVAAETLDGYNVTTGTLAANSLAVSATSSVTVVKVITPFEAFVTSYGLDPNGNGAFLADPDGDGIPNGMEFVLRGNPTVSNSSVLPTASSVELNGSTNLVVQFDQSKAAATQFTIVVQTSGDLLAWTDAVAGQNGVTIAATPKDANTVHVTVTIPTDGVRVFAQLKVTP